MNKNTKHTNQKPSKLNKREMKNSIIFITVAIFFCILIAFYSNHIFTGLFLGNDSSDKELPSTAEKQRDTDSNIKIISMEEIMKEEKEGQFLGKGSTEEEVYDEGSDEPQKVSNYITSEGSSGSSSNQGSGGGGSSHSPPSKGEDDFADQNDDGGSGYVESVTINVIYGESLIDDTYSIEAINYLISKYPQEKISVLDKDVVYDPELNKKYTILKTETGERKIKLSINQETGKIEEGSNQIKKDKEDYVNSLPKPYDKFTSNLRLKIRKELNRELNQLSVLDEKERERGIPIIFIVEDSGLDSILDEVNNITKNYSYFKLDDYNLIGTELPLFKIEELSKLNSVKEVWYNEKLNISLDDSVPAIHADDVHSAGTIGCRTQVGIVDTGLNDHPDLWYIVDRADFSCLIICNVDDTHGHGTHVAGIVASHDNTYRGMSYCSDLVSAKVLEGGIFSGWTSTVMNGIYWADVTKNSDIIQMSINSPSSVSTNGNSDFTKYLDYVVYYHGKTFVVSAGNWHSDRNPNTEVLVPGDAYNVITVGATDGDFDSVAWYSGHGKTDDGRTKVDVVAPGTSIKSLKSASAPDGNFEWVSGDIGQMSGTSMAAPHVSGLAALLVDYGEQNSKYTHPLLIKASIINSADKLAGWSHNEFDPLDTSQGSGRIDAYAAYETYSIPDRLKADSIPDNGKKYYTINVNNAPSYIDGTLVWERHVSSYTGTPPDLNDLDLYLRDINGGALDYSMSMEDNVEHIHYNMNQNGKYYFEVRGYDVSEGSSEYFVLASNYDMTLCWDYDNDGYLSVVCGGNDCLDGYADSHPGATEVCDGRDNDCDGYTDEGCPGHTCSSNSDCNSNYCEGSQSNSARCCSSSPPSDGYYCGSGDVRQNRDYYCDSSGNSNYEVISSYDCDNADGWYDAGGWVCDGNCRRKKNQEYRNYYCSGGSCTYSVTDTRTVYENCPAGDACSGGSCSSSYYCDSAFRCSSGSGDNKYNAGGRYRCQGRCDGSNNCDYAVNCEYCGTDTCFDSGDSWTVKDYIIDFEGCSGGACLSDDMRYDYCDGDTVYDRQCGASDESTATSYNCNNYDTSNCWCTGGATLSLLCDNWHCNDGACKDSGSDWTWTTWSCGSGNECGTQDCGGTAYKCYRTNGGSWNWSLSAESAESNCTDGHDNDCDGSIDGDDDDCWECNDGEMRDCSKQQGVCAGSQEVCVNYTWPGCDDSTYLAWNSSYENPEASCDNLDNDCDGNVDEGSTNENCQYVCQNNGYVWTGNGGDLNCCGNDANEDNPYELTESACDDGNDNDCDGYTDTDDMDCVSCTTPTNGMVIAQDTTFCPGTYNLPNGIIIGADNIILDCNGSVLNGLGGYRGIYSVNRDNNIIKNCTVMNYSYGIYSQSSVNNTLISNTAHSNNWQGIVYSYSSNNTMIDNNASDNGIYGINLDSSVNNTIKNNYIYSNGYSGINIYFSSHENIVTSNDVSGNTRGIHISRSKNNTITNNDVYLSSYRGISLSTNSTGNTIKSNNLYSNGEDGIYISYYSSNNTVKDNNVSSSDFGIELIYNSIGNTVKGNDVSGNVYGIYTYYYSNNNTVASNNVSGNNYGIYLEITSTSNNVSANTVCGNSYYDIINSDVNSGDDNWCDKTQNWDDIGTVTGCTYSCMGCRDDDGDWYNITGGICGPVDCNDSNANINPGAAEICNGIDDDCDNQTDEGGDSLCDDGLWCNGFETCDGVNGCQAGTPVDCSYLDDQCNDGYCDEENDQCKKDPTPYEGLTCNDGLFCNLGETCQGGDCIGGQARDCSDDVGCTDDSCDEENDQCVSMVNDANCDDGLWCNGFETCDAVNDCQAGTAVDCNDNVGCTDDSCDEENDQCVSMVNDANCDDGLWCNGFETCDAVNDCQAGTAVDCSDGNECTGDICDEELDQCENPNQEPGTLCGQARDCPESGCNGYFAEFYPADGHDSCDGDGNCMEYSCALINSYCTDNDPYDLFNTFECGAPCDEDGDCGPYCVFDMRYYDGSCANDCTCSYSSEDCNDYDANNCWCTTGGTLSEICDDWTCGDGECEDSGSDWTRNSWSCGSGNECGTQDCGGTTYKCYRRNGGNWNWATSAESAESNCNDGHDNDCDGLADALDPDCPAPDLTITDIWVDPENPKAGDWLTVYFIIKNVGEEATDKVYWEIDTNSSDPNPKNSEPKSLGVDERRFVSEMFIYAESGTYNARVIADPDDVVEESNEDNNVVYLNLNVIDSSSGIQSPGEPTPIEPDEPVMG